MRIYISDLSFSYDLHSLTKAFFQSEDVEVKEWGSEISNNVEAFYYRVETPGSEVREVRVENCGEDRPQFKNKIKREVYIILSELSCNRPTSVCLSACCHPTPFFIQLLYILPTSNRCTASTSPVPRD